MPSRRPLGEAQGDGDDVLVKALRRTRRDANILQVPTSNRHNMCRREHITQHSTLASSTFPAGRRARGCRTPHSGFRWRCTWRRRGRSSRPWAWRRRAIHVVRDFAAAHRAHCGGLLGGGEVWGAVVVGCLWRSSCVSVRASGGRLRVVRVPVTGVSRVCVCPCCSYPRCFLTREKEKEKEKKKKPSS